MVRTLGGLIGCDDRAATLCEQIVEYVETVEQTAKSFTRQPRIYFEEWDEPLISGIHWVSQLIEIAGGRDCFDDLAKHPLAKDRIIADPSEVIRRAPDIIIGSWCGKRFNPKAVRQRAGWEQIPAVKTNQLFEIKAPLILQPGPAALTEGLAEIFKLVNQWQTTPEHSA